MCQLCDETNTRKTSFCGQIECAMHTVICLQTSFRIVVFFFRPRLWLLVDDVFLIIFVGNHFTYRQQNDTSRLFNWTQLLVITCWNGLFLFCSHFHRKQIKRKKPAAFLFSVLWQCFSFLLRWLKPLRWLFCVYFYWCHLIFLWMFIAFPSSHTNFRFNALLLESGPFFLCVCVYEFACCAFRPSFRIQCA